MREDSAPAQAGTEPAGFVAAPPFAQHAHWPLLSRLPLRMTAAIPLRRFTLRALVDLEAGQLLRSGWASTEDIPIRVGAVALGWCEFEVVEGRMAVRLTRLA